MKRPDPLEQLADRQAFIDGCRAAALTGNDPRPLRRPDPTGDLDEQVVDHVRGSSVGEAFERVTSESSRTGETDRRWLRALVPGFLARSVSEQATELAARRQAQARPDGGFATPIAMEASPVRRRELLDRWERADQELWRGAAEVRLAAEAAARSVGAPGLAGLLGAASPGDPDELLEEFRRIVIDPLTPAIHDAWTRRESGSNLFPVGDRHPADLIPLRVSRDHAEGWPDGTELAVLRRLGPRIGADPDTGDVDVRPGHGVHRPELFLTGTRPLLLMGPIAGPGSLRTAVAQLGRAARWHFLATRRGAAVRWWDPGFDRAAEVVFRRSVGTPEFCEWAGLRVDETVLADLRLEEALAPRLAWTYLYFILHPGADGVPETDEVEARLENALGRSATPDLRSLTLRLDLGGADELRGTVYGLLLEERLLTRFGRRWFMDPAAVRLLRECWDAEAGQSVAEMAKALDLGTIEPTPVLDGCRP